MNITTFFLMTKKALGQPVEHNKKTKKKASVDYFIPTYDSVNQSLKINLLVHPFIDIKSKSIRRL
jgi:hypothetical protein